VAGESEDWGLCGELEEKFWGFRVRVRI